MAVTDRWHKSPRPGDATCGHADRAGRPMTPSSVHGLGDQWQARWRDPDGRQRTKLFARKGDADRHMASVTVDLSRGAYIDPKAGRVLLRDYAAKWMDAQPPGSSARTTRSRLDARILPKLGGRQLCQVTPSVVRGWLAELSRELEPATVRAVYGVLSGILAAAVDDGKIAVSPCSVRSVKPPKAPAVRIVPWTAGQVAAVADSIGEQWRALALAGAALGLRQGELLGLAVEDIDRKARVVHVRRQLQIPAGGPVFKLPKGRGGGKVRDVPLSDRAAKVLAAHMLAHAPVPVTLPLNGRPVTVRLLFTYRGRPVRHSYMNAVWARALTAAGMETTGPDDKVSMHALRHYAASSWLAGGVNIKAVAEYLGHTNAGFTLRVYAHLMPSAADAMRSAMDASLAECATSVQRSKVNLTS
jgi:integrase